MNSASKYYDMSIDVHVPQKWILDRPLTARGDWIIPRAFFQGKPVHLDEEPVVPFFRPGQALDFSGTGTGIAVFSQRLVSLWERLVLQGEIQFVPTRVEGQPERYFLLNTLRIIRCVDEARCEEVTFWEPPGDPSGMDHYRNIYGLKIDPASVGDAQVFRPWGWTRALLVSERIKQAMEAEGMRGARFTEC